ncbi:uncharacterized protein LOC117493205 [Trematomus bernacchii]|uniref:uncharacterized protein LOC117493205 n=1 Tax=Trematomus bernacchii TaxID=40690 RepID=UPI00146E9007|nr:uncharacterized protein LOC117493205 [Trematomus bernacchii]
MCRGVMERFRLANQPVPQGPTSAETMFQEWFDGGMVVRLDIFHWIHRFDAAVRTDSHSKYAVFNRTDLELLIKAVRAKDPDTFRSVSEQDVVRLYVTRDQLQHHVRRVTLGAQETFLLIHLAIEELKGPAGLDQSGVSLFKTPGAIDEMWVGQQRHLECIQDQPGMNMYRVARTTTINGVDLPYYKSLGGSNSLEGFHKSLPHMIPGPHCAARPYQVYLISGIARWNCNRSSDAVFGGKGRRHRTYSAPLIHRLNTRCQQLFGETVEENLRAPAEVDSHELLGLEYLFSQSTGESESGPFSLEDIIHDGPGPDEEVVQPGQPTPDPEADEAYQSDGESHCEGDNVLDAILPHITLVTDETSTVNPPAFEDACSQTSLPPVSLPRPPTPAPRPLPSPSPSTATRAIPGPSTRPIVPAIAGRPILPATSTIARPVPSLFPGPILPASQPTPAIAGPSSMPLLPAIQATPSVDVSVPPTLECIPSSWARSTLYKRKGMDEPSGVGAKVSRVQKLPSCTCCGQPTQGHKKYRR